MRTLALCIPTILVTLISGFVPWGLITAGATLVLYGLVLFLPSRTLVKTNVNLALEGLTYGDLKAAKDHIDIALREAETASKMGGSDIDPLRSACNKVVSALVSSGQVEAGTALRKRGERVISRLG